MAISVVKVENRFFKLSGDLAMVMWSKDYVALRVGTSQGKSAPCLVCVHESSARLD